MDDKRKPTKYYRAIYGETLKDTTAIVFIDTDITAAMNYARTNSNGKHLIEVQEYPTLFAALTPPED